MLCVHNHCQNYCPKCPRLKKRQEGVIGYILLAAARRSPRVIAPRDWSLFAAAEIKRCSPPMFVQTN